MPEAQFTRVVDRNLEYQSINIRVMKWKLEYQSINIPIIYLVIYAWIR